MKKTLSLFLAALMLLLSLSVPSFAFTQEEWDAYLAAEPDADDGIIMQPGADGTQKNFSWYAPAKTQRVRVLVAASPDLAGARAYDGKTVDTYQGDKAAKVTVTDLQPGATYYYACETDGVKSAVYSFSTPAADSFSALYVTDIHVSETEDPAELSRTSLKFNEVLTQAQTKADLSYILSAGDQASSGLRSEYVAMTAGQAEKSLTFALTMGNHDRKGVDYKYFKNLPNESSKFAADYQTGDYWFVQNDVLFLFLDSNSGSGADHRAAIKAAVRANPGARWRVAVMHHDLYSSAIPHRESETRLMRLLWAPLFDEFNIDLALLGHSHYYSVTNVLYNGKGTKAVENGGVITNAPGTVYMVSTSLTRPRGEAPAFGDRVAFGLTEDLTRTLYNIVDFTPNAITVSTYDYGTGELFATYTLEKTADYAPKTINLFRKIMGFLSAAVGTVYAWFNNFSVYTNLKEKGYDVDFMDAVNNNLLSEGEPVC